MCIFNFRRKSKSKNENRGQNNPFVAVLYSDSPIDIQSSVTDLAWHDKSILPTLLHELDAIVPSWTYQTLDSRTFNALTGICLALQKIADNASLDQAFMRLYSKQYTLKGQAAEALVCLGKYAVDRIYEEFSRMPIDHRFVGGQFHAYVLSRAKDPRAIDTLVKRIDNIRGDQFFVDCLAAYGKEYMCRWVALLKSGDADLRETGVRVLGTLRESTGVPALISALQDREPRVRLAAIISLGNFTGEFDGNLLIRFLDDADPVVQKYTILTLQFHGLPGVRTRLQDIVADQKRDEFVRDAAATALRESNV